MRIIWSPVAINKVEEIARYIAKDAPEAAHRWTVDLFQRVEVLEASPKLGRSVFEVENKNIRQLIIGNFRVIYRLDPERLVVLTVRHTRQLLDLQEIDEAYPDIS